MEEYLAMPKYRQDELKDVGGFVGGTFENNIRKVIVKGRDLLTLDMDNIPIGGTDEILKRVSGFGVRGFGLQHKKTRWVCAQTPCDCTTGCDRVSG